MMSIFLTLLFFAAGSFVQSGEVEFETKNVPFVPLQTDQCLRVIETVVSAQKYAPDTCIKKETCQKCVSENNPKPESETTRSDEENSPKSELHSIATKTVAPLKNPRNCFEHLKNGRNVSGVEVIYPYKCCPEWGVEVKCDQITEGGGWTVIQNRDDLPTREDFQRTWEEYALGFGDLSGEFWLGLNIIHELTAGGLKELRVSLEDSSGEKRYANYGFFVLGNSDSKYLLKIGRYTGTAGDSLGPHNGMKFSTFDRDNDSNPGNCAQICKGGWWYTSCHYSNLNGYQYVGSHASNADGINWQLFKGYHNSMRRASMMVRPVFRKL